MKTLFIVSPTVGDFGREALRFAAQTAAKKNDFKFDICNVEPDQDITKTVSRQDLADVDCLAAVGGDGTLSAVTHELIGKEIALGIVPAGTGNMVARELGIPLEINLAVALIAQGGSRKKIDTMRIAGRIYLLNAGVGINADVIDKTSRFGKTLFGQAAYFVTGVWKVLRAKPQRFEVTIDGQTKVYEAMDIAISNCGILARALNPNGPDVRADDGQIDVCITCMKNPFEYPWHYFAKLMTFKPLTKRMHDVVARRSVTIKSTPPLIVQADGDIIGSTPLTLEVLPSAVTVIVP